MIFCTGVQTLKFSLSYLESLPRAALRTRPVLPLSARSGPDWSRAGRGIACHVQADRKSSEARQLTASDSRPLADRNRQRPAADRRACIRSMRSQEKSGSSRPK